MKSATRHAQEPGKPPVIAIHNATINGATVRLEDVLACADKLEAWILREG